VSAEEGGVESALVTGPLRSSAGSVGRFAVVLGWAVVFLVLSGCGSASSAGSGAAVPPVHLSLTAPEDQVTILARDVQVTGTVSPRRATVLVAGQRVAVQAGSFAVRVPVRAGTNVIDVIAGAPHASGAVTAVRVYRQLPVAVPALSGQSSASATSQLIGRGLRAKVVDVGGFFQSLIPGSSQVCRTSPPAGQQLAPGTQVVVQVAKLC
jgi:Glucodextranase, domain B/PASTA domain